MAIDQESFNQRLYEIFKTRGYKPSPKDSKNERTNPQTADVFEFQFIKDGENYGKAWATIDKTSSLNIYYDDKQAGSPPGQTKGVDYDDSWAGLLKHLKQWALSKQLNFGLHDSDRLGDDMRQRDYYKMKEKMNEGYHAVNKTTSYNDNIPNVKVVIQHDKQIGEGEQRWRNVHKIFVENTGGERFAVPTRMPGIARVYGRHVAEGGTPYDERGKHITQLVEEYTKMAGFVRATRRGEFNESVAKLIAEGVNHHKSLKETLQKMQSHRGYNHYFEEWTPALMEDDTDSSSIAEMFAQETIDPRIESVLPILNKLNSNIINEIEEVNELDQWARSITEMEQIEEEKRDTHCSAKCCGADVKAEDCGCSPDCEHCNCNAKLDEAIKLPEITPKMGDNGSNTQSVISGKKVREEKEGMGSEDDDLADEESGKNHDPKTGKRTKPHPFDPEDEHLNEDRLNEGAFNRLVVDAMEMSAKEFAKKHPEMAHRYEDILAAFSEKDLKDRLEAPEQGELDLTTQQELDLDEATISENFRQEVQNKIAEFKRTAKTPKAFRDAVEQEIYSLKLQRPNANQVRKSEIDSMVKDYGKSIDTYNKGRRDQAKNARDASDIEAQDQIEKYGPDSGYIWNKTLPSDGEKVTIGTALAGMAGAMAPAFLEDELEETPKYVDGFMGADGKPTSTPTAADYASNKEFQHMKKKLGDRIPQPTKRDKDGKLSPFKKDEVDESGLQRYTGIKKYGKKGFEALQKAGRDGASEEEKGKIKDKYLDEALIDDEDFSAKSIDKEIKMAYGILNDPRYKGGNLAGAIKAIEGIMPGLSEHPGVKKAIYKTQNEPDNLEEAVVVGKRGFYINKDKMTGKETPLSFPQFTSTWFDEFKDDPEARNVTSNELSLKYEVYLDQLGESLASKLRDRIQRDDRDLFSETKAGGYDFAGDYKTGKAGQWRNTGPTKGRPAKVGDLVGAESKHADDEMAISMLSDEELAEYVGCSTAYAKANRDECEEVANDKSADYAPDNMLEDILRLSGYDQYKGKSTGKGAGTEYKV